MEKTIEIPEQLWEQLTVYLQNHPDENISTVMQSALSEKIRPRNGSKLIELAGIVEDAPINSSIQED